MQQRTDNMPLGIDISHFQADVFDEQGNLILDAEGNPFNGINFNEVKNFGVQFVYIKASDGFINSDGSYFVDSQFLKNVIRAKSAGLLTGGYHFSRPQNNYANAEIEAQHFINTLESAYGEGNYGDLMPVLDLEAPAVGQKPFSGAVAYTEIDITLEGEQLLIWAWRFKSYFEAKTNVKLMLYTAKWFYFDEYKIFPYANVLLSMPLWVAEYNVLAPMDFSGWTKYFMWQYTSQGQVAGINGDVDLDVAVSIEAIKIRPAIDVCPSISDIVCKTTLGMNVLFSLGGFGLGFLTGKKYKR